MTQEEKELLLKDLCARLPYGIMCRIDHDPEGEYDIIIDDERFIDDRIVSVCYENEQIFVYEDEDYPYTPEEIRPYLRPLSFMTEEERKDFEKEAQKDIDIALNEVNRQHKSKLDQYAPLLSAYNKSDWLNSHHFDYRGLIEKGLALEAPKGMYNF